ncbi:MAG: hypothetical protein EWM47_04380 [Anaerolineaceae bacterium]|nr:MAG: hypothetical protein EWM47_04380 [Anaerolineaceae bacterium]
MNQGITIELQFFMISILWGALVLLAYDLLRILRRIIRHNTFFVAVQDLVFWVLASVFIFAMIYVKNSGTIRGFSVMGMVMGMVIYHYILSDWIVKLISRLILLLLRPFFIVINYIRKGLRYFKNKIKLLNNRIYGQLKRKSKSVKILLDSRRQKRIQKKKDRKNEKKKLAKRSNQNKQDKQSAKKAKRAKA